MTKTQAQKRLAELLEKFQDLQIEFQDLSDEMQETANEIEPYENKNELTQQQEERQEWFLSQVDGLDEIINFDLESNLEI